MPKILTKGIQKIEIAPLAGDGGPGTVFVLLGYTDRDSETSINTAEPTLQEFFANETDAAVDSTTTPGSTTFKASQMLIDADDMILWFGGSKSGAGTVASPYVYSAGDAAPVIERTVKITPRSGATAVTFNRVTLSALINWDMTPTGKFLIAITGTVLQPVKNGVPRFTVSYPGVG